MSVLISVSLSLCDTRRHGAQLLYTYCVPPNLLLMNKYDSCIHSIINQWKPGIHEYGLVIQIQPGFNYSLYTVIFVNEVS